MPDEVYKTRHRIIEVNPKSAQKHYVPTSVKPHRRKKEIEQPKIGVKEEEDEHIAIPLEMMPILRTLMGYGRRINSLGALRGMYALEKLIAVVTPVASQHPEIVDALFEARATADLIRSEALGSLSSEDPD